MGLSTLGRVFGLSKKKKAASKNPQNLGDQLYENASENEKEGIRKKLRKTTHEQDINRQQERREATITVQEGPHMEALVRRELLMRAEETRGKLKKAGGVSLSFLKPSAIQADQEQVRKRVLNQKQAQHLAESFLSQYNSKDRREILHVLQSLDPGKMYQKSPQNIQEFFWKSKRALALYNQKNRQEIPFKTLLGQLFQIIQKEIQPKAIKKKQRLIRKANPDSKNPFANIDLLKINPQDILNPSEPIETAPEEALKWLEEEMNKARKKKVA